MLTAKGLFVMVLHFRISARRPSGSGQIRAVIMPNPPALDTALASSAYPTCFVTKCHVSHRFNVVARGFETHLHAALDNGDFGTAVKLVHATLRP